MNYTTIVSMIMKKDDLQTVLDAMSEYLQSSITIISEDMELIAFSKTILPRDHFYDQTLQDGYFSADLINQIYQDPFMKNFTNSSSVTCGISWLPDNVTLKYYITLPKDTYRYAITFTAFPLENHFDRQQQELFHSFARLIKNTYFHSQSLPLSYSYRGRRSILQRLLDRDYALSHEIDLPDIPAIDEAIFEDIQVLVFSPEYKKSTDALLHSYADSICSIIGNDYATDYNGTVVTVFHHQQVSDSHITRLIQLAEQANAKIGISWNFSGKEQVRAYYKQALFSVDMARNLSLSDRIFSYDDMFIYSLIENCNKRDNKTEIEHPALSLLKQYDKDHDSSLYDTLYCFLKCGMSSSLTAKKLNIHKSTLYHRMEIIKDLIPDLLDKHILWHTSVMLAYDMNKM